MPKRKEEEKTKSPNHSPRKRIKIEHDPDSTISEYERKRIENIRKNNELLAELNIAQAREDLSSISSKQHKTVVKSIKMKIKREKVELPRRQSLRIRRIEPDGITKLPDRPLPIQTKFVEKARHLGKLEMKAANDVEEKDSQVFLDELKELMTKDTKSITNNEIPKKTLESSRYHKLQVKDHHFAKVVPEKVYSIEFHRMQSKVLLFAGDKWGRLGIWDINSKKEDNIFVYEPHTSPIVNIAFDPLDQTKLVTASYDGVLRYADFSKGVFDEVIALDEGDSYFTYFGFGTPSSHTVLAASGDGQVRIVDCRKKGDSFPSYQLHDRTIKCLDVNPQRPNMFLTTTNKGQIAIWDIRNIKGPASSLSIIERSRSVSSAFFSPQTGQQILATGLDNFVIVSNISPGGIITQPPSRIYRHDNQTGRWLATFHAKWDPKNEKCFAIGSMKYPRQLDVFSTQVPGSPLVQLRHDNFTTVNSRIAIHPSLNIIAGGNSSGKVFVWTERDIA